MEIPIKLVLAAFNRAHKRMNVLYHNYARDAGISDAAFGLMYSLDEKGGHCTQTGLCEAWFFTPQTINSALKSLDKQGLITMDFVPNSRKNKPFFTESGEQFVKEKKSELQYKYFTRTLNCQIKEVDAIYYKITASFKLSESAFWILYTLAI